MIYLNIYKYLIKELLISNINLFFIIRLFIKEKKIFLSV